MPGPVPPAWSVLPFAGYLLAIAVVPLVAQNRLVGVLDLDSPSYGRFCPADALGLEALAVRLAAACDWRLAGIDGFGAG